MREGYIRNFVFGVEDSLVSTVGFVSGIASISVERHMLVLVGVVLVFVEAFSMAVGSFLSDESVREWRRKSATRILPSLAGAAVMFTSYIVAGALVLAPYLLGVAMSSAASIAVSLVALFFLGMFIARLSRLPMVVRGFRAVFVGGLAIGLGIGVAQFIQ